MLPELHVEILISKGIRFSAQLGEVLIKADRNCRIIDVVSAKCAYMQQFVLTSPNMMVNSRVDISKFSQF
jgi:hypothetical protein